MINGIRTIYPGGLNKGFVLKFCVKHETPVEGQINQNVILSVITKNTIILNHLFARWNTWNQNNCVQIIYITKE